jgi:hypothetical protein
MPVAYSHIGELVSDDINERFGQPGYGGVTYRQINRSDIEKVTLQMPDGSLMEIPVEARLIVEY